MMKRILGLAMALAMTASAALAADVGHGVFLGIGSGVDIPGHNWGVGSPVGFSAQALGGYSFSQNTAVLLGIDGAVYSYPGGGNEYDVYFLPQFQYTFDGERLRPYLLGGIGLNLDRFAGQTTPYFSGAAGGGVRINLRPRADLFVEAKAHFAFGTAAGSSITYTDYPVHAGVMFPLR